MNIEKQYKIATSVDYSDAFTENKEIVRVLNVK